MPVRGSDASQPYFIDMLFRGASGTSNEADTKTTTGEAARILAQGLTQSEMSAGDKSYLAQLVARRTGLPQADAEIRVTQVTDAARLAATSAVAKAKEVAEAARRASAYLGLWVFVSLLFGAFCAAYAGTIGGRQRDTNAPLHGVI